MFLRAIGVRRAPEEQRGWVATGGGWLVALDWRWPMVASSANEIWVMAMSSYSMLQPHPGVEYDA